MKYITCLVVLLMTIGLIVGCRGTEAVHEGIEEVPNPRPVTEPVLPEPKEDEVVKVEGYWEENTYINDFFGISLEVPEGWHRLTDEELLLIEATGNSILETGSGIANLLGISEQSFASVENFNPSLLINAYEGDYKDEDILNTMSEVEAALRGTGAEFDFDPPMPADWLGGIKGVEMHMSIPFEDTLIRQSFFVAAVDGWVMEVTATYTDGEAELFSLLLNN